MTGELRVNRITDEAGTGSPDFPNGVDAGVLTGDIDSARITDALNVSGSAPVYACRAWVNFDGTGTVAIRASGNVSSITDNGTGTYTVNFTTAMPDTDYSTQVQTVHNTGSSTEYRALIEDDSEYSINGAAVITLSGGSRADRRLVTVSIFR